jgi:multiple sugar transport system substrate-binding protein
MEKKPSNDPMDITIFSASGGTIDLMNKQYGDTLRKKFPNVNFNFIVYAKGTTIAEVVGANTPIDLIFGSIGVFHDRILSYNLQMDMSGLIKSHNYDLAKLDPSLVEMQRKLDPDRGIFGLPVYVGVSGLYYNKDIFDKFGVAYPKDNMTWDQMYELARKLNRTDGGVRYYGYTGSPTIQLSTNQLSLDPIDPKTLKSNFNTEPWKKFLETVIAGYKASGLDREQLKDAKQRALFEKDQVAAMWTNYSGGTPPETMNWDVVTVPTFKEAPGIGPGPYPSYWYVTSTTKHKDAAFEIIAFLTSEEFQVPFNRQGYATVLKDPAIRKQYGQDLPKYKGKHVESMFPKQSASPIAYTKYHNFAQKEWANAFIDAASGAKDINTALREAAEAVDKAIETQKGAK